MKQKIYFGFDKLKKILKRENSRNIFLVTGKTSFEKSGAKNKLNKMLFKNYNIVRFSSFSPNPKIEEIKKGLKLFEKENYDVIISIGGGSSIDVAKAIKLFSKKNIPLVAIPTTAGSGSESTYFIVYYIGKNKQSEGISEITLPNYAVLDSSLTMSLPKSVAASSGMDALGQAIESYWSIQSTKESKKIARKAIKLILDNLEKSVNNPTLRTRYKMMLAANMAGVAINISKTTACHSIAYPTTSYFKISHGHAVGMTLGKILIYNSKVSEKNCLDKRGVSYVQKTIKDLIKIIKSDNAEEASEKLYNIMESIGLKTKFSNFGIEKRGIQKIIKNGFTPERMKNNPRKIGPNEMRKILEKII